VKEAQKVINLKKKTLTEEKVKGMLIAKEKEKGLFEQKSTRKQLDTIVDPSNKPYLWTRVQFQVKGNFEISRYQVKKIRQ